ncbi:phosphatase PAP2 family protein [Schaalia sp. JY-X159]|uniref:phosphatase PAP2 family protein n=1 Tax=Schaalia sp. JY-X159 TaxID=2758575 RepID=UPI00165E0038|nr:phosphatase PAP2 family protein [Schaalia sp. JY-X159]
MSDQSREQYIATFARRVLRFRVLGVVAAVVSVVALAYLSLFTVTGQWLDTLIMYSFQAHMPFQDVARTVLHTLASIPALLLFALILIVTVLLRKRFALLVRIVALLVVSNGATQMLKYLLVRPDMEVGHSLANSFPSGHVTLATSVGLALIAAVPQRWKSVAGGVAWVAIAFVGVTVLSLGWHRLSDVLAGILVATAVALLVVPSEWRPFNDHFRGRSPAVLAWVALVVSAIGVALMAWGSRTEIGQPVSAMQITELAVMVQPGVFLAVFSTVLIFAVSSLSVLGVDHLAGN